MDKGQQGHQEVCDICRHEKYENHEVFTGKNWNVTPKKNEIWPWTLGDITGSTVGLLRFFVTKYDDQWVGWRECLTSMALWEMREPAKHEHMIGI